MLGDIQPLLDVAKLDAAQHELDATPSPPDVVRYIVEIVRGTRDQSGVILGASPRAAVHLLNAAKAHARLADREVPTREDVTEMAPFVLSHRIIVDDVSATDVVSAAIKAARS